MKCVRAIDEALRRYICYSTFQLEPASRRSTAVLHHGCDVRYMLSSMVRTGKAAVDTYLSLLQQCGESQSLEEGKLVHNHIKRREEHESNSILIATIIKMYGQCKDTDSALEVFENLRGRKKNLLAWNGIIGALVDNGQCRQAMELYAVMRRRDVLPDSVTFTRVLRACSSAGTLAEVMVIYGDITRHKNDNIKVHNALINIFAKHQQLVSARAVFERMPSRNLNSWNSMITGYAHSEQHKSLAIHLYKQMLLLLPDIQADSVTFCVVLDACEELETVQQIHADIRLRHDVRMDRVVQNSLVSAYGRCNRVDIARNLFDSIARKDIASWAAMLKGYAQAGHLQEALDFYKEIVHHNVQPNQDMLLCLLGICWMFEDLESGTNIHAHIKSSGFQENSEVLIALIDMYGKCGDLQNAEKVFMEMQSEDVVVWNSMMTAFTMNGKASEVLDLYKKMTSSSDVQPNSESFIIVLGACGALGAVGEGREIHMVLMRSDAQQAEEIGVQNALIYMYSKCGCLNDATTVFSKMSVRDVVSWTSLAAGYAQEGLQDRALDLYHAMLEEGVMPDSAFFINMLCASTNLGTVKWIHSCIESTNVKTNPDLDIGLMEMYGKFGAVGLAQEVFDSMLETDNSVWNSMMTIYNQNGQSMKAFDLYKELESEGMELNSNTLAVVLVACANLGYLDEGKALHARIYREYGNTPDEFLSIAIINLYTKCGCIDDAREVFDGMQEKSLASWNAMLAVYVQNGHPQEALELYLRINQEGIRPDFVTFNNIINACHQIEAVDYGKKVHERITSDGFLPNFSLEIALLNLYTKCGSVERAIKLFDGLRGEKSLASWTCIITAYTQKGESKKALALHKRMVWQGLLPDAAMYESVVGVCGDLQHGTAIHSQLKKYRFGANSAVETALISMYGRCGSLEDAREVFDKMETKHTAAWNAMITAYVENKNFEEWYSLYRAMDVKKNHETFVAALNACSGVENVRAVHEMVLLAGYEGDLIVQQTLVRMYAKYGDLYLASRLFDCCSQRDDEMWVAMVEAYAKQEYWEKAAALHREMIVEGCERRYLIQLSHLLDHNSTGRVDVDCHVEAC